MSQLMTKSPAKPLYVNYDHVVTVLALAAAASINKTFDQLDQDFLVDDIRTHVELAAVVGTNPIGTPLPIDSSSSVANAQGMGFLSQIKLQFAFGGEKLSGDLVPCTLVASDARRPGYPPTPLSVPRRIGLNVTLQNNTNNAVNIVVLLKGRKRIR